MRHGKVLEQRQRRPAGAAQVSLGGRRHCRAPSPPGDPGRPGHIPSNLVVDQWASDGESRSHRDFLVLHDV